MFSVRYDQNVIYYLEYLVTFRELSEIVGSRSAS
jgi:hypothetical protein